MDTEGGYPNFGVLLNRRPQAWARLRGGERYPQIRGNVRFYQTRWGVLVVAEVQNLPLGGSSVFGFCFGDDGQGAAEQTEGLFPPLLGANGYAYGAFLTDGFRLEEAVMRTVVLCEREQGTVHARYGRESVIAGGTVRR